MHYQVWIIITNTVDSDSPALCHDKIENKPCAVCSGSPHNGELSDYYVCICMYVWCMVYGYECLCVYIV